MIKTNQKYSDGSIVYLHNCKKCNKHNSAKGSKNKPGLCKECLLELRITQMKKSKGNTKHGLIKNQNYQRWQNMKTRCNNPNNKFFEFYGKRGITVHSLWINNPELYISYVESLPNANKKGMTVDRVFNDSNYEPMNLKWSTKEEQSKNTRPRKNKTGIPGISFNKSDKKPYRVNKGKRFKTIEEAIKYKKEEYGF